jgi:ABC-type sugar transport system ATPase subunit
MNINSILREKGRTSVFVAHRLRTIFDSDLIIVLKEGQVAEMGTHRELIDRDGVYAELWSGKLEWFREIRLLIMLQPKRLDSRRMEMRRMRLRRRMTVRRTKYIMPPDSTYLDQLLTWRKMNTAQTYRKKH